MQLASSPCCCPGLPSQQHLLFPLDPGVAGLPESRRGEEHQVSRYPGIASSRLVGAVAKRHYVSGGDVFRGGPLSARGARPELRRFVVGHCCGMGCRLVARMMWKGGLTSVALRSEKMLCKEVKEGMSEGWCGQERMLLSIAAS